MYIYENILNSKFNYLKVFIRASVQLICLNRIKEKSQNNQTIVNLSIENHISYSKKNCYTKSNTINDKISNSKCALANESKKKKI